MDKLSGLFLRGMCSWHNGEGSIVRVEDCLFLGRFLPRNLLSFVMWCLLVVDLNGCLGERFDEFFA